MEKSVDAQLVLAAQQDIEQFQILYGKYAKIVYRYIFFKVGQNSEIAEDLTSAVFMKALQSLSKYKDQGYPYSTYLYTLARTTCIDYYRIQHKTPVDIETVAIAADADDPNLEVDVQLLWKTLQEFEPIVVEVFELRYLEGLSFDEISVIVKKSPGSLRTLVSRTIRQLQKIYEE